MPDPTIIEGPYGRAPSGQPTPLQDGEFETAAARPPLFGMGWRDDRGVPRVIVVPNPAPGVDWIYTHSGPSWFVLRSLVATLVTAVAVATRVPRLQVKLQSVLAGQFPPQASQAASLTVVYTASSTAIVSADTLTNQIPLPPELIIKDAMTIGSNTTAIQAADQWSLIALLVEEFTDACMY